MRYMEVSFPGLGCHGKANVITHMNISSIGSRGRSLVCGRQKYVTVVITIRAPQKPSAAPSATVLERSYFHFERLWNNVFPEMVLTVLEGISPMTTGSRGSHEAE